MDITSFQTQIRQFVRRLRTQWQLWVLTAFLSYGISAGYLFVRHPFPRALSLKTMAIIGNITFFIAMILAIGIFILKSQVFSHRFSREFLKQALKQFNGDPTSALDAYLATIARRLTRFWILALGIILTGVVHFWVTLWPQYLHLLFIVGLFSLFLNYPRMEFFAEVPYQLQRLKMDYEQQL